MLEVYFPTGARGAICRSGDKGARPTVSVLSEWQVVLSVSARGKLAEVRKMREPVDWISIDSNEE